MTFCTFVDCYMTEWIDWGLIGYCLAIAVIGCTTGWVIGRLLK